MLATIPRPAIRVARVAGEGIVLGFLKLVQVLFTMMGNRLDRWERIGRATIPTVRDKAVKQEEHDDPYDGGDDSDYNRGRSPQAFARGRCRYNCGG